MSTGDHIRCHHCKDVSGYYVVFVERVTQSTDFNGRAYGVVSEKISGGQQKRCIVCKKIIKF